MNSPSSVWYSLQMFPYVLSNVFLFFFFNKELNYFYMVIEEKSFDFEKWFSEANWKFTFNFLYFTIGKQHCVTDWKYFLNKIKSLFLVENSYLTLMTRMNCLPIIVDSWLSGGEQRCFRYIFCRCWLFFPLSFHRNEKEHLNNRFASAGKVVNSVQNIRILEEISETNLYFKHFYN